MHLKTILSLGWAVGAALGYTIRGFGRQCGTAPPSADHYKVAKQLAEKEGAMRAAAVISVKPVTVNVYAHVVAGTNSSAMGYLTNATIVDQINVLNTDYHNTGFRFHLQGADWTINPDWAVNVNPDDMKRALRKGTYKDLNIYFLTRIDGNLGYSFYPSDATQGSNDWYRDGCVILASTTPGGREPNFNLGRTTTHEVGHWFGLFHTFDGGCEETDGGDFVDDTPAQESATDGCPIGRDSCPNKEGLDPIHNYMDYSYDRCMEEFTFGQIQRMRSYWERFRANK
ncbi:hypothetical protein SAPIO_CDS0120 [Scedosporium apiospermum]|uniref:Peptidase M43 pregnancy-associated plasma-A domain-containing protein n=1 Tax=Pseudallescheria apiosperma TaxID=563466 RepID=A0A084GHK3_PSEDA|nr:uncharacterized protein SAPIO_CDS0120 [Scedosporium apiospermum]KEZ46815.1 hypothetical protein SAPIO_CDS0120 [Scedosporium apiospermum]